MLVRLDHEVGVGQWGVIPKKVANRGKVGEMWCEEMLLKTPQQCRE